jgi:uncharacterized LabA/DUF88 family protein
MGHSENLSIGVFIDGGYFAKIDEGLAKKNLGKVNVKGLFQYIPEMISKHFGIDRNLLYITEAHYYRGRFRANDADNRHLLLEERQFEDTLIENDIIFHYKHLRPNPSGGIIEKGIDTWFALDTYELTLYRDFDYVVLISGDADHEMLARKLKALKTHTILLTWDPANTGSTSRFLSEEVCTHIDIMKMESGEPGVIRKLTVQK